MEEKYVNILKNKELSLSEKSTVLILSMMATDNYGLVKGYSLVELSEIVNVTKPTLIKILESLEQKGYLIKAKHEGKYAKNSYRMCVYK